MTTSLFIAWRPPRPDSSRLGWRPVGRLTYGGRLYRFCYTQGARKPGFRPFSQMTKLDQVYTSTNLFPLFSNRLLSASRPEYEHYLRWGGFDPYNPPDPIVVLGVTEGIRQTDAVEVFPCPAPAGDGYYINKFFLHGVRWFPPINQARIARLTEGEPLNLMLDLQNEFDQHAVAVRTVSETQMIGYVPRYLAHDVGQLIRGCGASFIDVKVERVNLDAPAQNRLLCRMSACWPQEFTPCSGEDFTPIPADEPHCLRY